MRYHLKGLLLITILFSQHAFASCDWPVIGTEIAKGLSSVDELFSGCDASISQSLGELSLDQKKAVFSSIAAYSAKPYGGSTALKLEELLADEVLDCDNYVALASYIYASLDGVSPFRIVGFNGGAVGNHAQAIIETEAGDILLDPTVGIVALIGFNDLLRGTSTSVYDFKWRDEISWYHDKVMGAVSNGEYKPSDLTYWFPSLEAYRSNAISSNWATPGAHLIK